MGKLPGHMKRFRGWHKQQQHEIAEHADMLRRLEVHAAAPRVVSTQLPLEWLARSYPLEGLGWRARAFCRPLRR